MLIKLCLFNLTRIFQVSYKLQLLPTSEICNFHENQTASQVPKYRFSRLVWKIFILEEILEEVSQL